MKELFIERDGFLRLARVDDGQLKALRIIRDTDRPLEGDICTGIIKNVSRAQQAVFVDIGSTRNAYLRLRPGKAAEAYHVGDLITVEVLRSESGKKGAKITDEISLTNGSVVVTRGRGHTFSGSCEPQAFYERHGAVPVFPGIRLLIRSAALTMDRETFQRKTGELVQRFEEILLRAGQTRQAGRLHRDTAYLEELLDDIPTDELLLIHSNDAETSRVLRQMGQKQISEYPSQVHLFHRHGLEVLVERLRLKTLPLPGGGSLVIEETEALTAIDVNSGSRTGKGLRLSAFELNEAALILALEQIRLRNLAGIIVIDFVTMERENDGIRLFERARELTRDLRPLTNVYPLTELGLLQIARRRQGESVTAQLFGKDNRKKAPVTPSYLYKLIRIRLDEPVWEMKRFEISLNPAYGLEMKALEELIASDYPDLQIRLVIRPDVDTVKVMPVIG